VNARFDLNQIKRLADKILGAGLQCAQFVAGLCSEHDHWQVGISQIGLESFHHLKTIHARHLQVEQNQIVGVLAMQRAYLLGVHGRRHVAVTGLGQQLVEEADIGLLIIDDENFRLKNSGEVIHNSLSIGALDRVCAAWLCEAWVSANFSTRSRESMNSLTLIGLVR